MEDRGHRQYQSSRTLARDDAGDRAARRAEPGRKRLELPELLPLSILKSRGR